ncbi:unnamed protein product, partial [Adineta steineri]
MYQQMARPPAKILITLDELDELLNAHSSAADTGVGTAATTKTTKTVFKKTPLLKQVLANRRALDQRQQTSSSSSSPSKPTTTTTSTTTTTTKPKPPPKRESTALSPATAAL